MTPSPALPLAPLPAWSYVTNRQLCDDTMALASGVGPDCDAIIGCARSGLVPAGLLALHFHRPLGSVSLAEGVLRLGSGFRLESGPEPRRVLLVDDTVSTGRQMALVAPLVRAAFPGAEVTRAAVYADPAGLGEVDVYARLSTPHFLEWNLWASGHAHWAAFDCDGVLCHDCEPGDDDDGPRYRHFLEHARPLHLPRKAPVPLVVTARHETYRAETLAWLDRHQIRVNRLVMRDFPIDWAKDGPEKVAGFKAEAFAGRPELRLFIESDPRQAEIIASLSGRTVVCNLAAKVWPPAGEVWPEPAAPWAPATDLPPATPFGMRAILAEASRRRAGP